MGSADIGVIGLAVMGQNLALNMADQGLAVAVYNRSPQRVDDLMVRADDSHDVRGFATIPEFLSGIARPRRVVLMVQAGDPVDEMLRVLAPMLDAGDVVIDGGNSFWKDTDRRAALLESRDVLYVGAGVSGGEEGARYGPSIMPGGAVEAWPLVQPVLEAIAAKAGAEHQPCCSWIGPGGSGHFVKMVHNGIEYGDMQVLAEAHLLLRAGGYEPAEQAKLFAAWNRGRLDSYLVEITAAIMAAVDDGPGGTGAPMVDVILDAAGQKGTGKWTVDSAMELGQPMMLVTEAVGARMVSSFVELRQNVAEVHPAGATALDSRSASTGSDGFDPDGFDPDDVEAAIDAAKVVSYAQGFMVLQAASDEHGWDLDLAAIARVWRGGCIIRAAFLDDIATAFEAGSSEPSADDAAPISNLLLAASLADRLQTSMPGLRRVVGAAVSAGIAVPALASAVTFFDGIRSPRTSAALIQAQRDFFGAHTYERVDRDRGEFFHTNWSGSGGTTTSGSYSV